MIRMETSGRTEKSGLRDYSRLRHTPLLVFVVADDMVKVDIVSTLEGALWYSDDTKVMGQWRGEWSSDFFQFTVGQLREHIKENPRG